MNKLPLTPPKPPPTTSSMNRPAASSLPPRPPPSQVSSRKPVSTIVPALPIGLNGSKKTFAQAQGIGRGHSSLPPKPAFPGKPLPRDTDAIVLTPGEGDGSSFPPSSKSKRAYSSANPEATMRPMDPAVTNLTPQNTVRPSGTSPARHGIPQSITPPVDSAPTGPRGPVAAQNPETPSSLPITSPRSPPAGPKAHHAAHPHPNGSMDGPLDNPNGMYQGMFPPEHHAHNMGLFPNGALQQDMYPVGSQFGMQHHPYPHPHQPGFFGQRPYHGGTLTPPNSGSMFVPPPPHAHVESYMFNDGDPSGPDSAIHHRPFSPPQGFPTHSDPHHHHHHHHPPPPHYHPGMNMHPFPPMLGHAPMLGEPHALHGQSQANREPDMSPSRSGTYHEITTQSPATMHGFVPDGADKPIQQDHHYASDHSSHTLDVIRTESRSGQSMHQNGEPPWTDGHFSVHVPAIERLESFTLSQFLNKRLSDVCITLFNPATTSIESFPAHSFILSRSDKLFNLLDGASSEPSATAEKVAYETHPAVRAELSSDGRSKVIIFETSVKREPFLLALRTLYGAPDWKMDAYLDPNHPNHRSSQQSFSPVEAPLSASETPSQAEASQQVKSLERSIQLFSAGILLGMDDIVHKAINNIKRWGMTFEGEGYERLLKFILEDVHDMKAEKALASGHWDFTNDLLGEAIEFLTRSLPRGFKLDFRAPNSNHLIRFTSHTSPPAIGATTPVAPGQPKALRRVYSTVLLSLPFDILKTVLESESMAFEKVKHRFDLAAAVIQERERRRKRELKALQDLGEKVHDSDATGSEKSDTRLDSESDLFWEESVVSTFGHGGIGIEITKRRKGGPGGRMLWKVGKRVPTPEGAH